MTNEHLLPTLDAMKYLREEAANHLVVNKKLHYKETALFFRDLLIAYSVTEDSLLDKLSEDFWEED